MSLMSTQLYKPSFIDLKTNSNNLLLKIYGAKLYIPYKNLLLVATGFFIKDNFKLYKEHPMLKKNYMNIHKIINTIDIPKSFIKQYIQKITLKELIVYSNIFKQKTAYEIST